MVSKFAILAGTELVQDPKMYFTTEEVDSVNCLGVIMIETRSGIFITLLYIHDIERTVNAFKSLELRIQVNY